VAPHRPTAAGERHARSERIFLILGFLVAVGALLFFAWIAEEMLEGDTIQFDAQVRSAVHAHSTDQLTAVMKFLTDFGSSAVMIPLATLTLVLCYIKREFHILKMLGATFGGALLLEFLLKTAFHRTRPIPFFDLPTPASYSFPSGHALFSFCFFAGLAVIVSPRLTRLAAKIAVWIVAVLLILGIGFSRIYLGVHYPSDVLAGYSVGLVWVSALGFVHSLHGRNVQRERTVAGEAAEN
jgi:membrane-associated phospholipid phosphatase